MVVVEGILAENRCEPRGKPALTSGPPEKRGGLWGRYSRRRAPFAIHSQPPSAQRDRTEGGSEELAPRAGPAATAVERNVTMLTFPRRDLLVLAVSFKACFESFVMTSSDRVVRAGVECREV